MVLLQATKGLSKLTSAASKRLGSAKSKYGNRAKKAIGSQLSKKGKRNAMKLAKGVGKVAKHVKKALPVPRVL